MPATKIENGPWGAAIRYWLPIRDFSQADLVRATGLGKNTIGSAVRGLDVNTKTLRAIAAKLGVAFEDVLVSPEYRQERENRQKIAADAADIALRKYDEITRQQAQAPPMTMADHERVMLESLDVLAAEADRQAAKEKKVAKKNTTARLKSSTKKNVEHFGAKKWRGRR